MLEIGQGRSVDELARKQNLCAFDTCACPRTAQSGRHCRETQSSGRADTGQPSRSAARQTASHFHVQPPTAATVPRPNMAVSSPRGSCLASIMAVARMHPLVYFYSGPLGLCSTGIWSALKGSIAGANYNKSRELAGFHLRNECCGGVYKYPGHQNEQKTT